MNYTIQCHCWPEFHWKTRSDSLWMVDVFFWPVISLCNRRMVPSARSVLCAASVPRLLRSRAGKASQPREGWRLEGHHRFLLPSDFRLFTSINSIYRTPSKSLAFHVRTGSCHDRSDPDGLSLWKSAGWETQWKIFTWNQTVQLRLQGDVCSGSSVIRNVIV